MDFAVADIGQHFERVLVRELQRLGKLGGVDAAAMQPVPCDVGAQRPQDAGSGFQRQAVAAGQIAVGQLAGVGDGAVDDFPVRRAAVAVVVGQLHQLHFADGRRDVFACEVHGLLLRTFAVAAFGRLVIGSRRFRLLIRFRLPLGRVFRRCFRRRLGRVFKRRFAVFRITGGGQIGFGDFRFADVGGHQPVLFGRQIHRFAGFDAVFAAVCIFQNQRRVGDIGFHA
uniref:Uncharacterized protein n=1 Tax=Myoviridae sp. ctpjm1 TaxID=2826699 RepID=A0A8S5NNZ2_9CAUD|nr:MAG TPA: hypothetical protein [Myoviridae sp. ctpjm1]